MPLLRRTLASSLFLGLFAISALCAALSLALYKLALEPAPAIEIGVALMVLLNALFLFVQVHRPLKHITKEMKALLTGKPYQRLSGNSSDELGVITHFFNEITRNLEGISGNMERSERLNKELNTAQAIQQNLLPKSMPKWPGLEIAGKTRPASEIGGDTFDFFQNKDRYLMYIGDSTGHGLPAGLVMIMVDTLLETFIDLYSTPKQIMVALNRYIKPHLQPTMFMTMMLLQWQPQSQKLLWTGAGHEYLVHGKTHQGKVESLPCGGIAVGMVAETEALLKEQEITLEQDDFVILYSDGISEAKNTKGELYGLERLSALLQNQMHAELSAEDLFNKIATEVGQFMEGHEQEDDMTLIVLKKTA